MNMGSDLGTANKVAKPMLQFDAQSAKPWRNSYQHIKIAKNIGPILFTSNPQRKLELELDIRQTGCPNG